MSSAFATFSTNVFPSPNLRCMYTKSKFKFPKCFQKSHFSALFSCKIRPSETQPPRWKWPSKHEAPPSACSEERSVDDNREVVTLMLTSFIYYQSHQEDILWIVKARRHSTHPQPVALCVVHDTFALSHESKQASVKSFGGIRFFFQCDTQGERQSTEKLGRRMEA